MTSIWLVTCMLGTEQRAVAAFTTKEAANDLIDRLRYGQAVELVLDPPVDMGKRLYEVGAENIGNGAESVPDAMIVLPAGSIPYQGPTVALNDLSENRVHLLSLNPGVEWFDEYLVWATDENEAKALVRAEREGDDNE